MHFFTQVPVSTNFNHKMTFDGSLNNLSLISNEKRLCNFWTKNRNSDQSVCITCYRPVLWPSSCQI